LRYFDLITINNSNKLIWSTASESNSSHFILESSQDGNIWYPICDPIKSRQNAITDTTYSFLHNSPQLTVNYYYLVQYDINGNFKRYGPILADNTKKLKKVIMLINTIGQEVDDSATGLLIEIYEDGTTKKIIK
jgi:hypothetical protein